MKMSVHFHFSRLSSHFNSRVPVGGFHERLSVDSRFSSTTEKKKKNKNQEKKSLGCVGEKCCSRFLQRLELH